MADDTVTLPGTGADVAVDRIAGDDYQLVKLVDATEDSLERTGVDAHPLVAEARMAFVDFDDSIVPVTDNADNHWLPVAVRGTPNVAVSAFTATAPVLGSRADTPLAGPSDGTWNLAGPLEFTGRPGMLTLAVRSTGGTPTVAAFGASDAAGTFDQQLPLVVPDGDSLVLAETFTPGVGARFCYILAPPPWLEIRAVSGGTATAVDATLTIEPFQPPIVATVRSGAQPVTDNGGTLSVDDGAGSITVDNVALSVTGSGTESGAQRVTIATDSTGVLSVDDNGSSLTVDNSGTFATQVDGAALTSLQLIDDIVYTDDTSTHATGTSKGALFMAAATPTDSAVNANDIGAVAMTTDRKLHVSVQDALPAGSNAIGKLAANSGVDIGDVDVTSVSGTVTIAGTAATDAPVSGNPLLHGGRASTTKPAAVSADGDAVPLWLTLNGAMVTSSLLGLTSTLSNVSASASSVNLLGSNTGRRSVTIVNDSTAICKVKEGTTASATSYTWLLQSYDTLILDGSYSGAVDAIWDSANGAARITERS